MKTLIISIFSLLTLSLSAQTKTTPSKSTTSTTASTTNASATAATKAGGADFGKYLTTAKESYKKTDLEDTHYNLLLSLQQLDMKIGEEILKILPEKMDSLASLKERDNVTAMSGSFIGTSIHREYGMSNKMEVDIVSNSPLVGALNGWLNNPMMAGMSGRKAMKVDGYKGSYTFEMREETDAAGQVTKIPVAEMQIPIHSSLITLRSHNIPEDAFVKLMGTVPVTKIAEMLK